MLPPVESEGRKARALARQQTAVLHRTHLEAVEHDLHPLAGSEAVSLVAMLTRESWAASGEPFPDYARASIPVRFVPRRLT